MPNKTIYVSDDDLTLFQRAQELVGGNLSGAVVTALRRFIDLEEGRQAGFDEIVLQVGRDGVRQVRFQGSLLGEWRDVGDERVLDQKVYRSRKGKLVLHTHTALWKDYPTGEAAGDMKDWKYWRRMFGIGDRPWDWGDYEYEILDDVAALKGRVPDKLYRKVEDIYSHPQIEELDI
ncbi:EXLDI protein [Nocardia sp. NPDC050717]|uniref:EXLDI protein n=1 Tax=Nocardia sp. NPDC050717 TaxID=3157221 RepID=UPI0033DAD1D2